MPEALFLRCIDHFLGLEELLFKEARNVVDIPPFAGQRQLFGQIAPLEVENAVGQGAALSAFEAVPNPVHEFGHGRNGARNDVIVAFRKRFGTRAAGFQIPQTQSRGHAFDDGDLLADGIDGRETRFGEEDRQRNRRKAAAAADVENARPGVERADLGNSQRVEHVTQVQLVEILARDDVDLRVPVGVKVVQRRKPLPLAVGEFGEIFENQFQILTFNP